LLDVPLDGLFIAPLGDLFDFLLGCSPGDLLTSSSLDDEEENGDPGDKVSLFLIIFHQLISP
jgi:hypothetical protein